MASADADRRDEEAPGAGEDEDTGAQVAPIVRLEEVAVTTGEENEDVLLDLWAFCRAIDPFLMFVVFLQ